MASPNLRKINTAAVAKSLESSGHFNSNQGAVWNRIEEMSLRANVKSPTEAMDDVFKQKENILNNYLEAFLHISH